MKRFRSMLSVCCLSIVACGSPNSGPTNNDEVANDTATEISGVESEEPELPILEWLKRNSVSGEFESGILFDAENSEVMEKVKIASTVSNIKPLEKLRQLWVLSISGTQVTDLSPLFALRSLDVVILTNSKVQNIEALERTGDFKLVVIASSEQIHKFKLFKPEGVVLISESDQCEIERLRVYSQGRLNFHELQHARVFNLVPLGDSIEGEDRSRVVDYVQCSRFVKE